MSRQQQIEAAVVLFAAILYLTGSFWKAILVSIFVLVSCVLGFGLRGSFSIAIRPTAGGGTSQQECAKPLENLRRTQYVDAGGSRTGRPGPTQDLPRGTQ